MPWARPLAQFLFPTGSQCGFIFLYKLRPRQHPIGFSQPSPAPPPLAPPTVSTVQARVSPARARLLAPPALSRPSNSSSFTDNPNPPSQSVSFPAHPDQFSQSPLPSATPPGCLTWPRPFSGIRPRPLSLAPPPPWVSPVPPLAPPPARTLSAGVEDEVAAEG